jgi:hypothetical protein
VTNEAMSIIYEALKKIENSSANISSQPNEPAQKIEQEVPDKKEHTKYFLVSIGLVIFAALFYIIIKPTPPLDKKQVSKPRDIYTGLKDTKIEDQKNNPLPKASGAETAAKIIEKKPTYALEGIIYDENVALAIINGISLKTADVIDNYKIISIEPSAVRLQNLSDNTTLTLYLN